MTIAIVTDSMADFPEGIVQSLRIRVVKESTPEAFLEAYKEIGGEVGKIIVIVASEKIDGTIFAARRPKERLPSFDIRVIDSHSVSFGEGFVAIEAAKITASEKNLDTIECEVKTLISKTRTLGFLGRRWIDPIVAIENGGVRILKRTWRRDGNIPRLIEIIKKEGEMLRLGVFYASAQDLAQEVAKKLEEDYSGFEISIAQLNPVPRAYFGLPGLVGVCGLLK